MSKLSGLFNNKKKKLTSASLISDSDLPVSSSSSTHNTSFNTAPNTPLGGSLNASDSDISVITSDNSNFDITVVPQLPYSPIIYTREFVERHPREVDIDNVPLDFNPEVLENNIVPQNPGIDLEGDNLNNVVDEPADSEGEVSGSNTEVSSIHSTEADRVSNYSDASAHLIIENPNPEMAAPAQAAVPPDLAQLAAAVRAQGAPEDPDAAAQRDLVLQLAERLQIAEGPAEEEPAEIERLTLHEARRLANGQNGRAQGPLAASDLMPIKWSGTAESGPAEAHVAQCEDYFIFQGLDTFAQRLPWFQATLAKEARVWFEGKYDEFRSWDHVKREFIRYFGGRAPCKEIALQKFRSIKWDGKESADEYLKRIQKQAAVLKYNEAEVLQQFQFGLPAAVKLFLQANKPGNIEEAVEKLQIYADVQASENMGTLTAFSQNPFTQTQFDKDMLVRQVCGELMPLITETQAKQQKKPNLKKEVQFEDESEVSGDSRDNSLERYKDPSRSRQRGRGRGKRDNSQRNTSRNNSRSNSRGSRTREYSGDGWKLVYEGPMDDFGQPIHNNNANSNPRFGDSNTGYNNQNSYGDGRGYYNNSGNNYNQRGRGNWNRGRGYYGRGSNSRGSFRGRGRGRGRGSQWDQNNYGRCFSCGSPEHFVRDCPHNPANQRQPPPEAGNQHF